MRKWTTEDSGELYNIKGWGIDYFAISDNGNVTVSPRSEYKPIEIKEVIDELQLKDVSTPVLLRFPDILDHRIELISNCFKQASEEYLYKGQYYVIYPIKVNQMRPVVEELISQGSKYNIGLEAGSKPELHAVLAITDNDNAPIICNGYKDEDFIELALLAQKMGKAVYLVVEKLNELKLIINIAKKLKVRPNIGIRIKLSSSGSGKWEESGGDRSKFGLNASELLEAIGIADENNMKDCIKLIHFHLGSQITMIRKIKTALKEVSQFYVELTKLGCEIEYVDIGGGLGVDYDGSRSTGASSINYTIQEYINDAVATIVDACEKHNLVHPNIITESGRALTAHHSVLVFDVLETTSPPVWKQDIDINDKTHEIVVELNTMLNNLTPARMLETWHDALQLRQDALDLFSLGHLDLNTRAMTERLFWSISIELYNMTLSIKHPPEELKQLGKMLADKYFCNFSLFQSLPDSWAIDQIFPIMPIHRLNKEPKRRATLQDITCDSDGKIDMFIGKGDLSQTLPVHELIENEPYYIAVFLVGAYQEILGDLHNLFGDTNAVHINATKDGYEIKQIIDGETVADVLDYVQYNPKKLVRAMESWVTNCVKSGKISTAEGKEYLAIYRSGLYSYTYLEA
ncbi:MAG: biosynthetic arginine decarboxylase [Candidatus Kapaibacteriota bacterium]|jgi:arginine decarboxylase